MENVSLKCLGALLSNEIEKYQPIIFMLADVKGSTWGLDTFEKKKTVSFSAD